MDVAAYLDSQLRAAGIPIIGVSLTSIDDRAGWRVLYAPEATDDHRAQAETLLQTITVDAATLTSADEELRFQSDKVIRALVIWCAQRFGITVVQARQQLIAIYRSLSA